MKQKMFYGIWIVVGGFILLFFGIGMSINTFGTFMNEIARVTDITVSQFSFALTIAGLVMTIVAIIVGKLIDKIDIRIVMGVGTTLYALSFILFSQCETITHFYLAAIVMGMGSAGTHVIPVTAAINNWFDKYRGLVTGIIFAGTGIGGLALNPLMGWLIEQNHMSMDYGYQSAYFIGGILTAVFCIPTAIFIMRKTPQEKGLLPDGLTVTQRDLYKSESQSGVLSFTLGEVVRQPAFWLVGAVALFFSMINMGVNSHMINYFNIEIGFSVRTAQLLFSGYLGMTILGKIVIGILSDKKGLAFAISLFVTIVICALMILINAKLLWIAIVFFIIGGFGNVIQTVIPPMVTAHCFGTMHYAIIFGIISIFMSIGSAIGTPLAGKMYEYFGTYVPVFILFAFFLALSLIFILVALRLTAKKKQSVSDAIAA